MALLILYLLLALGVSFLCSLVEASILSLRRAHVAQLLKEGKSSGRILKGMKENIDRPLAAILTLNTVAHTVGAAGVGAQALVLFGRYWVAVTSAILTVLILVFSEIIPKTLGAVYAGRLAAFTAYTIRGMIVLTYPLVVAFQGLSRLLASQKEPHRLSRKEFALIAELGHEEGALGEDECRIIRNLLSINSIPVKEILTPRTVTFMLQKDMTIADAIEQGGPFRFSRIPIYGTSPDDPVGIVLRHNIHERLRNGSAEQTLEEIANPIRAVPEMASVAQVLKEFIQSREHLFLVVDEYGGIAGIVTLEDAVESLLGEEIVDESDVVEDMRQLTVTLLQGKLQGRHLDLFHSE